jgi:hypothetical protein
MQTGRRKDSDGTAWRPPSHYKSLWGSLSQEEYGLNSQTIGEKIVDKAES